MDAKAGTKALTPQEQLYNEPPLPSVEETNAEFERVQFPIADRLIDTKYLIIRAMEELRYLNLTASTNGQYLKAWREFYNDLYLRSSTVFDRNMVKAFIEETTDKLHSGKIQMWKWKILRRAAFVLIEVADTGRFEWKTFTSRKPNCRDEALETLRIQYRACLETQNLEIRTVDLHDYCYRCFVEGTDIHSLADLRRLSPEQIQALLETLGKKLNLNSIGTVYPIIRQILTYFYAGGLIPVDYSGMIMSPMYRKMYLKPYLTSSDEEKLIAVIDKAPLRTRAMMWLAIRLGLRDTDICNLKFTQIDWRNDQIILNQEKTGVSLTLPLLEDVGNAIMDYILNERPSVKRDYPYVFLRRQAPYRKLSSMYPICAKMISEADIQTVNRSSKGVHVCRYTLTHKLLKAKIPHQIITDTLGHVSKESDKPYLSMEEEMLRECPLDLSFIGQKFWREGEGNE